MNNEFAADLITLVDEEGTEHEFEILDVIENEKGCFFALSPTFESPEEEIDFRIDDIEDDYKNKRKEEFLNYVGHLYYAKYRCIEIYDRLQGIEDEA